MSPFVRPLTGIGLEDPDPEPVAPPFDEVQVASKCKMVLPPLFVGGVNVTEAELFPAVAVPIVGASGTSTMWARPIVFAPELDQ